MTRRSGVDALLAAAALLLAACASELPIATDFDDSAGSVTVTFLGDGFVRVGARRVPFEAFVLELRQRARAMTQDQRDRYVVRVRFAEGIGEGERARAANADYERLLLEVDIMDIGQVVYG